MSSTLLKCCQQLMPLLVTVSVSAQGVYVDIRASRSEAFEARITNDGTTAAPLRFQLTVQPLTGNPVLITYQPYECLPGSSLVSPRMLRIEAVTGSDSSVAINESGIQLKADASIHVTAMDATTGQALVSASLQYEPHETRQPNMFGFHGSSQLQFVHGADPFIAKVSPGPVITWEFMPELTVGPVPIGADVLVSSAAFPKDRIQICFDAERFKDMLRDRLEAMVTKETSGLGKPSVAELQRLASLQAVLSDSSIQSQLRNAFEVDSLMPLIQDHVLSAIEDSINRLRSKVETELDSMTSDQQQVLRDKISALQTRLAQLRETKRKAEQLKEYTQQFDALMKLNSEKEALMGKVNSATRLTDLQSLALDDVNVLRSELVKRGGLSQLENKLTHLENLQLGNFNPVVSPLILWGTTLTGIDAAISTNNGYSIEALAGKVSNSTWYSADTTHRGGQESLVGLALGKNGDGHSQKLHFLYSPKVVTRSGLIYDHNRVLGMSVAAQVLKGNLRFTGDGAYSMLRVPSTAPGEAATTAPLTDLTDFALSFHLNASVLQGKTQIKVRARHIGPEYYSVGMPWLRTNTTSYEARADSKITSWLSLGGFARQQEYWTSWDSTARFRHTGASLRLTPTKSSTLMAEYAPAMSKVGANASLSTLLTCTGLLQTRIGSLSGVTIVNGTLVEGGGHPGDSSHYSTRQLLIEQGVVISQWLSVGGSVTALSSHWSTNDWTRVETGATAQAGFKSFNFNLALSRIIDSISAGWLYHVKSQLTVKKTLTFICALGNHAYFGTTSPPQHQDAVSVTAALRWTW